MTRNADTYRQFSDRTRQLLDKYRNIPDSEIRYDLLHLTQELETAHIELEVQNEDLRRALRDLEASRRELFDLYESAPRATFSSVSGELSKRPTPSSSTAANPET